jgi:serine protease Do
MVGLTAVSLISFSLNIVLQSPRTFAAEPARAVRAEQQTDTMELSGLQDAFERVAKQAAPCVVAISASINAVDADDVVRSEDMNTQRLTRILDRVTRTVGTGFIIDAGGYIVTNEHVVADAEQIWITTDDRKIYPAIVVGTDPRADLAVLKVPATNLPVAKFAAPGATKRGQWTIALGNPYGLAGAGEMAMSVGVVSALDRALPKLSAKEDRDYSNLIQTTAEINPGNSGGPLFDLNGNVIGINAAVILPQKETSGLGFAFPITQQLLDEIAALKEGREVVYGYMGVTASTLSARSRKSAGVNGDIGVLVESLERNAPATGVIKASDIILTINDRPICDSDQFASIVARASVEQPAKVMIVRDGKTMNVTVRLGRRPTSGIAVTRDTQRIRWRGLVLGPIPANWDFGKTPRPDSGIMVIGVSPNSPLAPKVTIGSVITSVAGKPVRGIPDLQSILNDTPPEQCNLSLLGGSDPQVASMSASN